MKNLVAQKWIDECGTLFPIDGNTVLYPTPGSGIFELYQGKGQDKRIGLKKLSEKFEFNHKIYDVGCDNLFDIIQKTWESDKFVEENKNLGVIFTGYKGTGKSVSAKLLCNRLDIPVIIIPDNEIEGMVSFIQQLDFECIVLIDEAEKTFKRGESDEVLLKLIDGVYNRSRKLYILTTNTLNVNENLLGRPGRIRYIKQFGNLSEKAINEYLDDNLKIPEERENILQKIDLLEISTIDILGSIVDEVNIHEKLSEDTCLNIPLAKYVFDIMKFPVETEEDVTRIKEILRPGRANFPEWLGKDCEMEDKDSDTKTNEDYCSNILDGWKTRMTSQFSSLWKNQELSIGTILEDPDEDGFILVKDIYGDGETLVKIIRQKGNPSLYRGGLMF